jgi:hypothetical protein
MVSVPGNIPYMRPVAEISALLFTSSQLPPDTASDTVIVEPSHTEAGPDIVPATGNGSMLIFFAATAVPQMVVIE